MEKKLQYLLIYIVLLFHRSQITNWYEDKLLIIALLLSLFIIIYYNMKLNIKVLIGIGILAILQLIICVYTNNSLSIPSVLNTIILCIITYISIEFNKEEFLNRLVKTIVFLAAVSLIGFIVWNSPLESILVKIVPTISNGVDYYGTTYGGVLYHHIPNYYRNVGIYREPGLYQIVLSVGLFIVLYFNNIKLKRAKRIVYSIILILTLITAQSTTGYISLIILLLGYLIVGNDIYIKRIVSMACLSIVVATALVFAIQGQDNFIQKNLFSKIQINKYSGGFKDGTGRARTIMMKIDFDVLKEKPLGLGYDDYLQRWKSKKYTLHETSSAVGLSIMLCVYGVIVGTIIVMMCPIFMILRIKNIGKALILVAVYFNTILAQPTIFFPIFMMFLFLYDLDERGYYESCSI